MRQTIYGDIYFLINFSMDFLALYICCRIMHLRLRTIRMVLAAVLGGVYATAALFISSELLIDITAILFPLVMCFVAYGKSRLRVLLKNTFVFYATSFLLGGVMTAVYYGVNKLLDERKIYINGTVDTLYSEIPITALAILAALCALFSLVWGRIFKANGAKEAIEVTAVTGGGVSSFRALLDSGNLLVEPLGNLPVIVVNREVMAKIIPANLYGVFFGGRLSAIGGRGASRVRIIPVSSVGGSSVIKGFVPDYLVIRGEEKRACIAYDPNSGDFGGCDGIMPSVLL